MDVVLRTIDRFDRAVTKGIAAALSASAAVLARVLGRGSHRKWRRDAEAAARSRPPGTG